MRSHVLGVTMDNQFYIELLALIVSVIALFISYFNFKENEKSRIELGSAFLSMELIQTFEGLYVILRNIGNTYAYDVKVDVSADFVNGFENLSIIQPDSTYRFLLLSPQNIADYSEIITFTINYHDYYSPKQFIEKKFKFKVIDFLKYDISYNKDFNCYDIKKSF